MKADQIRALELLFNATQGHEWKWRNETVSGPKWSFTYPQSDPCNDQNNQVWQGITCSSPPNICHFQACEIVSLSLRSYNLNGTLPSEFFVPMSSLMTLEISLSRDLVGSIPPEIGSLAHLVSLSLDNNHLTGTIPHEIGSLSQLVSLFLYNNLLTGTIPHEIGSLSDLASLSLDNNQFTGTIPPEIWSLLKLVSFFLYRNQMTGTIPSGIGSLSRLSSLNLYDNQLTGTIPIQIGSLSELVVLYLGDNHMSGIIPSEICFLTHLEILDLYSNHLIGTIPSQIGFLSGLETLILDYNELTGIIPPDIGDLSEMVSLSLYNNLLTGFIPREIGSLSQLASLTFAMNQLTGMIPSEIGSLSQLVSFYLYRNQLTGSIPPEIGSLSKMVSLYLHHNLLTGTIPPEIGWFSELNSFYLDNNQVAGTIPFEIGSISQLVTLFLHNNQLTGSLPSSFSKLHRLVWLHAFDNHLSGQITFPLALLPQLQQLFLHQNHFTGHLNPIFSSSSEAWNASFSKLLNLDLSGNLFSGSIPSSLFLPHLRSISLSLNCFEHELPSSICEARDAGVISMDGLGSAKGCKNVVTVPFTSVSLVRSLDGNIPDCVWSMSKLRMLNLAGNGLRGSIGTAASMSSLLSLTMSHNYLSGKIPLWLQTKNLSHLDLSYNKLTGDANGFRHQDVNFWNSEFVNVSLQYSNRSLALTVNRLSGDLPNSFAKYANLDILSGNLFGCANLLKNDENSDSVTCGSEEYDQTLQLMGGLLGSIMFLLMVSYFLRLLFSSLDDKRGHATTDIPRKWVKMFPDFMGYLSYYHSLPSSLPHSNQRINHPSPFTYLPSTISFGHLLSGLMRSVCVLTLLSILFSLPIYVLKQLDVDTEKEGNPQYVTHSHMYNWLWTMAFLSGTIPAIILLVTCFVCLSFFTFVINRLGGAADLDTLPSPFSDSTASKTVGTNVHESHSPRLTVWGFFILNIGIVGTANGLYLWSTLLYLASDVRIWIQFSFGLFSFLWSVVLRHGLPSKIKESRSGIWLFTRLNVMNSVVIPCMATALSSPSCYQVTQPPPP
jgi:Leucine-rich repeat (LRR) protein